MTGDAEFFGDLAEGLGQFGIVPADAHLEDETPIGELRRARKRKGDDSVSVMTLRDVGGVLRWEVGCGEPPVRRVRLRRGKGRARTATGGEAGEIKRRFKFRDLPPNAVSAQLSKLDDYLIGKRPGLRLLAGRDSAVVVGEETEPLRQPKRILLLVHGTFSNVDQLLEELNATAQGQKFLAWAADSYDQLLAFNHPTLSVGPMLNAGALAQHFCGSEAEVDVVCHGRGGLVTRWWLEALDPIARPRGRVIYVGSPLEGTGLAAPVHLKQALDLLTNIAHRLSQASEAVSFVFPAAAPIAHAAGVLFSVVGKTALLAAKTPASDFGIALVPGLAAQAREGCNAEIRYLSAGFEGLGAPEREERFLSRYYFVTANFETLDRGWLFWRYFRRQKMLDIDADWVFKGESDLVVDTESMTALSNRIRRSQLAAEHVLDFGQTNVVHHLNYFQQPQTIDFMRGSLEKAL
jgi:hypothetical protein